MTKTYEFKAVLVIKIEAESPTRARAEARALAELIGRELPSGASLIRKSGDIEVNEFGN